MNLRKIRNLRYFTSLVELLLLTIPPLGLHVMDFSFCLKDVGEQRSFFPHSFDQKFIVLWVGYNRHLISPCERCYTNFINIGSVDYMILKMLKTIQPICILIIINDKLYTQKQIVLDHAPKNFPMNRDSTIWDQFQFYIIQHTYASIC